MITKDKVRATILGVAAGDALGMPVETFTAEKIGRLFGRVTTYITPPDDHKWFAGRPAGVWTDDTSLTIAILKSLTEVGSFEMDSMARHHIAEYDKNKEGFGPKTATARAIMSLKAGKHWSETGDPESKGNGVAMKIAPVGIFLALLWERTHGKSRSAYWKTVNHAKELARMTHANNMGEVSGIIQAMAVYYGLGETFSPDEFAELVCRIAHEHEDGSDNPALSSRLEKLREAGLVFASKRTIQECGKFGNGGCYVLDSLPWSYAFFLRRPWNGIETLFDVVNAGGDTDTNGAIVGALLGARNGMKLFDDHEDLIEGLWRHEEIEKAINAFCDRFEIQ